MSQHAAQSFLDALATDPVLAEQAATIPPTAHAIAEFARERGYDFTPAELDTVASPSLEERELTDAELDQVAGGQWILLWQWDRNTQRWVATWIWQSQSSPLSS